MMVDRFKGMRCFDMDYCRSSCIFSSLSTESCKQIESKMRRIYCLKGHTVFSQGISTSGFYILCSGAAKLTIHAENGKKALLGFYGPGDLIGVSFLSDARVYNAYAEALEESLFKFIDKSLFFKLIQKHPKLSKEIICKLSNDLEIFHKRVTDITSKGIGGRLVATLLDLGEKHGVQKEGDLIIDLALTHQSLAQMIGSSRQTVTKELAKLKQRGLITLTDHRITLVSHKALTKFQRGSC